MKLCIAGMVSILTLLISGCVYNTYKLDGSTYSDADQFQAATDALLRDTEEQLVKELHVQAPVSTKRLLVGIPSLDAIKSMYELPNVLAVTTSQISLRNNLAEYNHKQYEMIARTIKRIGIYAEVTTVETTAVRLQPSSTESVLYVYIAPETHAAQWYIDGVKQGIQTVSVDMGQPKSLGRLRSFFNSVKGYVIGD